MSYPMDVNDIQYYLKEWTERQFPERDIDSILNHLKSEVEELRESPDDVMEFADCFMLLFDAASFQGLYMSDIYRAMEEKLEINKRRTWGKPNADGFCEHVE